MSLITFGNQNTNIFKGIHWTADCPGYIGFYQTVSRCKYKPDFFDFKCTVGTIDEVLNYPKHNLSFSDIMDTKILEALKKANDSGKNLMIMYSGGIDSTAICVAALKNLNKEDYNRVTILCTPQSYYEFPDFFQLLNHNFKIEYCSNFLEKYVKDHILVTGMVADLLFGSNGWVEAALEIDPNLPNAPFKDAIPKICESLYPKFGKKIFDIYYPIAEEAPYEIKTASDFIFWYYYTQCYQPVYYAYIRYSGAFTNQETFNDLFNFYHDPLFEYYCLNNLNLVIPHSHSEYKKPAKEYICEYLKDYSYMNKKKFPSYGEVIEGNRWTFGVTENWEFLSFDQSLKYFKFPK